MAATRTILRGALKTLREHAEVLVIIGGLIIFFSWTITNTLVQDYTRLKLSVESARSNFDQTQRISELRSSLNSLGMEMVHARDSLDSILPESNRPNLNDLDRLRNKHIQTTLSAHQVLELTDFTSGAATLSRAVGTDTLQNHRLESIAIEATGLYDTLKAKRELVDQIDAIHRRSVVAVAALTLCIEEYDRCYTHEVLPRVSILYPAAVEALNILNQDAADRIAELKSRAETSQKAALSLYLIGSAIALSAQFLHKTNKSNSRRPKLWNTRPLLMARNR